MASFFESKGWRVTCIFGPRKHPLGGKPEFHKGIDLVKSHKAPVPAFCGGLVTHASEGRPGTGLGSYGNVVTVKSDDGRLHVYAHLDSVAVKVGQKIKEGDIVGRQGNSGASAGSHLHYEIRKKAAPAFGFEMNTTFIIDPAIYWKDDKYIRKELVKADIKPVTPTKNVGVSKKTVAAKPAATKAKVYTVVAGDSLGKIARDHGISLQQLLAKNPQIKNASVISIGQKINL
jgi:murein DD-endopeptidase MepM/ murein hydrolase activator NlpD